MPIGFLSSVVMAAVTLSATAQSPQVLRGEEITESVLVEALTPTPPQLLTRGIRRNAATAAAPKPAKAALLITFETNATILTAEAKHALDIVGQALNTSKLASFNFIIEGHADPRGSAERNLRLSEGRAEAVKQYLVGNQSVSADRLQAVGKGDREPLNTSDPAAPENRRVTFVNMAH